MAKEHLRPATQAGPGRPKGAKNKNSVLRDYIEENYPKGEAGWFKALIADIEATDKPADRAKLRLQLMEFMRPKLKAIDSTIQFDEKGQLTIVYGPAKPANEPK